MDAIHPLFFNQSRVAFLVQSCFWLLDQLNHLIGRGCGRSKHDPTGHRWWIQPVRLCVLAHPRPSLHFTIYYAVVHCFYTTIDLDGNRKKKHTQIKKRTVKPEIRPQHGGCFSVAFGVALHFGSMKAIVVTQATTHTRSFKRVKSTKFQQGKRPSVRHHHSSWHLKKKAAVQITQNGTMSYTGRGREEGRKNIEFSKS